MDQIFGNVSCYECGKIVPADECDYRTIEVETGRSGSSVTFVNRNSSGKSASTGRRSSGNKFSNSSRNSTRSGNNSGFYYNTGRKYYKKLRVHVCKECQLIEELIAQRKRERALFWVKVILGLVVLYYSWVGLEYSWNWSKNMWNETFNPPAEVVIPPKPQIVEPQVPTIPQDDLEKHILEKTEEHKELNNEESVIPVVDDNQHTQPSTTETAPSFQ